MHRGFVALTTEDIHLAAGPSPDALHSDSLPTTGVQGFMTVSVLRVYSKQLKAASSRGYIWSRVFSDLPGLKELSD